MWIDVGRYISQLRTVLLSRSLISSCRIPGQNFSDENMYIYIYIYAHMHEMKRNISRTQAQSSPPIPGPCVPYLGVSRTGVLVSIWKLPPLYFVPESWTRSPSARFCKSSYRLGTYTAVIIPWYRGIPSGALLTSCSVTCSWKLGIRTPWPWHQVTDLSCQSFLFGSWILNTDM